MKPKLWGLLLCLLYTAANGQSIYWDNNFGNNGVVVKAADKLGNSGYETGESSVQLTNGDILVAVNRSETYLHRYHPDGMLDTTFANKGRSSRLFLERPKLHRLASGKILLIGTGYLYSRSIIVYRLLADGNQDVSFNNGGPLAYPLPNSIPAQIKCATLADGKLMLFASPSSEYSPAYAPRLIRLTASGDEDPSFGSTAKELASFPANKHNIGFGLSGDKIVSGYLHPQTGSIVLAAFGPDGKIDSSFGFAGNGTLNLGILPQNQAAALSTLQDGRLLVGASIYNATANFQVRYEVRCLLPNGSPDPSFGSNGVTIIPQSFNQGRETVLLPDANGFTCIGFTGYYSPYKISFSRFNNNGIQQFEYGANGQQTIQITADYIDIRDALAAMDGTVTLTGRLAIKQDDYYFITRMKSNGQPDLAWSAGGSKFDYIPGATVNIGDIKPLKNGNLLARINSAGSTRQSGLIKFTASGAIDNGFGSNGMFTTNIEHYDTLANGGIVLVDRVLDSVAFKVKLKITRLLPNGQPDNSFGPNGNVILPLLDGFMIHRVYALSDDKILVYGVGMDDQNTSRYFACQILPDAQLDKSFGSNGFVFFQNNPTFYFRDFLRKPDGRLLFAGVLSGQRYSLVQLLPNGQPDPSFGNNGVVNDSSELVSDPSKLHLQPDGNFLLVHYVATTSDLYPTYKQVISRFNGQGKKFGAFGSNGRLENMGNNFAVLSDGRLLQTSYTNTNTGQTLQLTMRKQDGVLDSSFGEYGIDFLPTQITNSNWFNAVSAGNRIFMTGGVFNEFETKALIGALAIDSVSAAIASFTLVDATSDKDIRTINNGDTINLADVRGKRINIRVNTSGTPAGSVAMQLNGPQQRTQMENSAPYALFGNTGNNYWNWTPAPGFYSLFAKPYKGIKGSGAPGKASTVAFRIKDELTLSGLSLVNADNNRAIRPLVNNAVVDLAYMPYISVRANPGVGYTESVLFLVNGFYHRVENTAPFAIAADDRGDYYNWTITPGAYNISAIPFPENDGKGQAGTQYNIWINVVNSKPGAASNIKAAGSAPELKTGSGLTAGVYPNPVAGEGTLTFGAVNTTYLSVALFDVSGAKVQQLFNGKVEGGVLHRTALNMRQLKAGAYFCRILTGDGRMQTVQVVKQ